MRMQPFPEDPKLNIPKFRQVFVSTTDILHTDTTYRMKTRRKTSGLISSIRSLGLIHPPFLYEKAEGYGIVTGFSRIHACMETGMETIPAYLAETGYHDRKHPDPGLCAVAVGEAMFCGNPGVEENVNAAFLMLKSLGSMERLARVAKALGLPENREQLARLCRTGKFPPACLHALYDDIISLPVAEQLARQDPETMNGFLAIFTELRPGLNKQREIMTRCTEIARIEELHIKDLLNDAKIGNLVFDAEKDPNQRTRLFREYLYKRRYPEFSGAMEKMDEKVRSLGLGKGMQLFPPPHLEGDRFTFQLQFSTTKELEKHVQDILDMVSRNRFRDILYT